jgi:hypothetical protein
MPRRCELDPIKIEAGASIPTDPPRVSRFQQVTPSLGLQHASVYAPQQWAQSVGFKTNVCHVPLRQIWEEVVLNKVLWMQRQDPSLEQASPAFGAVTIAQLLSQLELVQF